MPVAELTAEERLERAVRGVADTQGNWLADRNSAKAKAATREFLDCMDDKGVIDMLERAETGRDDYVN